MRHRGDITSVELAGDLAGKVVTDGDGEEPHAERLAHEARRDELRHGAQADR